MNKIMNQILDFPQLVNQKIFNAKLNSLVTNFDSTDGVRHYVKTIYQWASLLFLIAMEYHIILAAKDYYGAADVSTMGKLGSVLSFLVLAYSAFPIAAIIRSRGESLGDAHKGMISFVFKDFVMTNIRIFGEVMAVIGLSLALTATLSFVFDTNLFTSYMGNTVMSSFTDLYSFPLNTATSLMSMLHVDFMSNAINALMGMRFDTEVVFGSDFVWNPSDLGMVANSYFNVLIGLVVLYVNLAVYTYLYAIVSAVVNFIPKFAFPIAIRTKNES